jgi:hypothetical protein
MPTPVEATDFPEPNCLAHPDTRSNMRKHFRNIHSRDDTFMITEEGPLPRCGSCGPFQRNVGQRHRESVDCKRWTAIFQKREDDAENKTVVAETSSYSNYV